MDSKEVASLPGQGLLDDGPQDAALPEPGQHWRSVAEDGDWALVRDVLLGDGGDVHSVEWQWAPGGAGDPRRTRRDFIDDFMRGFRLGDGESVWRRLDDRTAAALGEQQAVAAEISGMSGAVAQLGGEADLALLAGPEDGPKGDSRGLAGIECRAQAVQERIAALATSADEKSRAVAEAMRSTADHRKAHAEALMRQPHFMLGRLQRGVDRLRSLAGEGDRIIRLLDGPLASEPGPIHMYQQMRYMDEEYLIHLSDGGADIDDWGTFGTRLMEQPKVLDRLVPAQVGMCLMRIRRERKDYDVDGSSLEAALADLIGNAQKEAGNMQRFLLFRDGGSVWAIFAASLDAGERLWPTEEERLRAMRASGSWRGGEDGGRTPTGRDDIRYPEAVRKRDAFEHKYRRLALTLRGIQEREGLFRGLGAKTWERAAEDPDLVRWVADDEFLLDGGRRPLEDALDALAWRDLAPGARVLCDWRRLADLDCIPGMGHEGVLRRDWRLVEDMGVATVRRSGRDLYVETGIERRWLEGKVRKARALLNRTGERRWTGGAWAVLNVGDLHEVQWHMESRISRRRYLEYIKLFMALLPRLRSIRRQQSDARAVVGAALRAEGIDASAHWGAALMAWLRGRGDAPLPASDDKGFDKACEGIADIARTLHLATSDGPGLCAEVGEPDAVGLDVGPRGEVRAIVPQAGGEWSGFMASHRTHRRGRGGWRRTDAASRRRIAPAGGGFVPAWQAEGRGSAVSWANGSSSDCMSGAQWAAVRGFLDNRDMGAWLLGEWETERTHGLMMAALMEQSARFRRQLPFDRVELVAPLGGISGLNRKTGASALLVGMVKVDLISYGYHHLLDERLRGRFDAEWRKRFSRPDRPRQGGMDAVCVEGADAAWMAGRDIGGACALLASDSPVGPPGFSERAWDGDVAQWLKAQAASLPGMPEVKDVEWLGHDDAGARQLGEWLDERKDKLFPTPSW